MHIVDADHQVLESGPADFETYIDWIHRATKKKNTRNPHLVVEIAVPKLPCPGHKAYRRLHNRTSEAGTACPIYLPTYDS